MADTAPELALARKLFVCIAGRTEVALAPLDAALLAWLALEGPTPRAHITALLWPDKDIEAARNSLRQRLFKLRKQLGVELIEGTTTLALANGVQHDLDDADSVLGDINIEIEGEFVTWLEHQRSRRRARMRQSLAELSDMAEGAREWSDALTHANELLSLEPLSEDAHRRVMRLHYLAGDRAAALQAFDRCEQVFKDEVGTKPSAETLALLATIEEAGVAAGKVTTTTRVPASVLRPPRLVGRERELAALTHAWQAEKLVALIGEAGLGKTRLLHEFSDAQPGTVCGGGRPGDAGVPFAMLARLLRAVVAQGSASPLPASTCSEIARVLPEFAPGSARSAGEGQRLVLLRAVRALLVAHPLVSAAVVDDLHFADEASLDMLAHLIDGQEDGAGASPWRWVLAWRPAEAGSPLQALHDRLVERMQLVPVALAPLTEPALAELVDSLGLPGVDGKVLAPGLLRRTGGNPLFVLETLKQAWVERTLAELADSKALQTVTPISVGRLIERRLAQLSPGALALARLASISGVDFTISLAEQVLRASSLQFADALNELEAAHVLRGTQFAHDLVYDTVRAGVPSAIAQHLHSQVAAWIGEHGGEPARVASHWIAGGRAALALPWLERAADAARLALRPKEVVDFLDRKAAIEDESGDRAAAFASLLAATGTFVDIDNDDTALAARCDRLDHLATSDAQRAEALLVRGNSLAVGGYADAAVDATSEALRLAIQADAAELAFRIRYVLGSALGLADRHAEAVRHLESCAAWGDVHCNKDIDRANALGGLATTYDYVGRLEEALPLHRRAYDLCLRAGALSDAAVACGNLAGNRIDAGDMAAADEVLRQGQQLVAANDGLSAQAGALQALRTLALTYLGRYRDALVQAELGADSMRLHQSGREAYARLNLARVWWHLGQWTRMLQELDAAAAEASVQRYTRALHARLAMAAAWAVPLDRNAQAAAREALEVAATEFADNTRPDLGMAMAIDLAGLAEPKDAVRQLRAVRKRAQAIGHIGIVLATHIRAAAAAAGHDPEVARSEALQALALADQGRQTTALLPAELWLHSARALLAAQDPQAQSVLQQGRDWLLRTADEQVPEPFRDSFLNRNPVNRDLLALASRLLGH